MKNTIYIIILILCGNLVAFSQNDSSKIKLLNDEKKMLPLTAPIKAIDADKKIKSTSEIDLNNTPKIAEEVISNVVHHLKTEPQKQFVFETQPLEKDVIVKKYWMGNDITHKKIESTVSLGNVNTKSKQIKIEFRDFGLVDGDRIQIYLNEKVIKQNVVLNGNFFFIYVNLESGYNRIDIKALNEGTVGPNTAAINVYDDFGNLIVSNQWNLASNEFATLGVLKN